MFGRHPKLAVDALLGLSGDDISAKSKNEYAMKLRGRLTEAYRKASEAAMRAADINKQLYDRKARASDVVVGNLVLVRNVTVRVKHKIADLWEEDPYVAVGKRFHDEPVFDVNVDRPNTRKTRRLHRNLLLPLGVSKASFLFCMRSS